MAENILDFLESAEWRAAIEKAKKLNAGAFQRCWGNWRTDFTKSNFVCANRWAKLNGRNGRRKLPAKHSRLPMIANNKPYWKTYVEEHLKPTILPSCGYFRDISHWEAYRDKWKVRLPIFSLELSFRAANLRRMAPRWRHRVIGLWEIRRNSSDISIIGVWLAWRTWSKWGMMFPRRRFVRQQKDAGVSEMSRLIIARRCEYDSRTEGA